MSGVGDGIRALLLATPSVVEIVAARIYPGFMPQGADNPAIVYRVVSTRVEHTIGDATDLCHSRVEISCIAGTREKADELAKAARKQSGISGYRGTVGGVFINGVEVDSGDQQSEFEPNNGGPAYLFVTTFDFMVHYTEI